MKNLILIITVFTFLTSCNLKKEEGFILKGEIKGIEDCYLYYPSDFNKDYKHKDSILIEDGSFEIKGKVDSASRVTFATKSKNDIDVHSKNDIGVHFEVVLENTKIELTGKIDKYRFFEEFEVKGSVSDKMFRYTKKKITEFVEDKSNKKYEISEAKLIDDICNYSNKFKSNDGILIVVQMLRTTVNPLNLQHEDIDKLIDLVSPKFQDSEIMKELTNIKKSLGKRNIGEKIIDFTSKDTDGKEVKLYDLLGKSYTIVDCWASWCGPCRDESKFLKEAMDLYGSKGLQIVGYSYDKNKKSWLKAIEEDKIQNFIHVSDLNGGRNTIATEYQIHLIPDNFILDNEGKILANNLRGNNLLNFLKKLYE